MGPVSSWQTNLAPMPWASAPDICDLGPLGVIGSRAEVLACLLCQEALRSWLTARRAAYDRMAREIVGQALAAAVKAMEDASLPAASLQSAMELVQAASARVAGEEENDEAADDEDFVVKNLDTGLAVSLSTVEMLYKEAPESAFAWDGKRHQKLAQPNQIPAGLAAINLQTSSAPLGSMETPRPKYTPTQNRIMLRRKDPLTNPNWVADSTPSVAGRRLARLEPGRLNGRKRLARRGAVLNRGLEPLMSGPLLKRGKKLGKVGRVVERRRGWRWAGMDLGAGQRGDRSGMGWGGMVPGDGSDRHLGDARLSDCDE